MAGSVNQNSRFDLGVRKVFFIPAPKIVLQQYRPLAAVPLNRVTTAAIEGAADQMWS
jgi:hypothetical protein